MSKGVVGKRKVGLTGPMGIPLPRLHMSLCSCLGSSSTAACPCGMTSGDVYELLQSTDPGDWIAVDTGGASVWLGGRRGEAGVMGT